MKLPGRTWLERKQQGLHNEGDLRRWKAFLASRQENRQARDIRAHVLENRQDPLSIGYPTSNLTRGYAREMPRLFPALRPHGRARDWGQAARFLATGAIHDGNPARSHPGLGRVLRATERAKGAETILFEQGFLASALSWIHAYRDHDPKAACLGYVYDDIAHYYMADYPNRLIERLNSEDAPTGVEIHRARRLIDRIRERKISKYNAQPMPVPPLEEAARRVLVCDQSYADASTVYGRIDDDGFRAMLDAAVVENPDAEILVKTHPDTALRPTERAGYFNHLISQGQLRLLRDPVNPYSLFELVDTVYVGTSQMGLEALFAGRRVVTFGAPFYAGWGLTDDRQAIPHRLRRRSLEEIFHYFYVWYTIYHVPGRAVPSEVEDALDFIEATRPG